MVLITPGRTAAVSMHDAMNAMIVATITGVMTIYFSFGYNLFTCDVRLSLAASDIVVRILSPRTVVLKILPWASLDDTSIHFHFS